MYKFVTEHCAVHAYRTPVRCTRVACSTCTCSPADPCVGPCRCFLCHFVAYKMFIFQSDSRFSVFFFAGMLVENGRLGRKAQHAPKLVRTMLCSQPNIFCGTLATLRARHIMYVCMHSTFTFLTSTMWSSTALVIFSKLSSYVCLVWNLALCCLLGASTSCQHFAGLCIVFVAILAASCLALQNACSCGTRGIAVSCQHTDCRSSALMRADPNRRSSSTPFFCGCIHVIAYTRCCLYIVAIIFEALHFAAEACVYTRTMRVACWGCFQTECIPPEEVMAPERAE
jgi:hypothetical protein